MGVYTLGEVYLFEYTYTIWLKWTQFTLILVCIVHQAKNTYHFWTIDYIIQKPDHYIMIRNVLYHVDSTSFLNNYIMQKLTISRRHYIFLYVKARVTIYITQHASSFMLKHYNQILYYIAYKFTICFPVNKIHYIVYKFNVFL